VVKSFLKFPGLPGADATDAPGFSVCPAHAAVSFEAIAKSTTKARKSHAQDKGSRTY
jgi:crossover junction endodeoxyribonuclease RuvC